MKIRESLLLGLIIAMAFVSCARYPNIPRVEEMEQVLIQRSLKQ